MTDLTKQSDRLIEQGRELRDDNRAGGRHRQVASIGRGSANLKSRHWMKKARNIAIAVGVILGAVVAAGIVLDGIGFIGVVIAFFALLAAFGVFGTFPRMKVPQRADLDKGTVGQMVGRTELWLEHQRPALPPPAAKIVDDLGVQLDALGLQLETVDQAHPAAREVRSLVGDVLPETIDAYRRIPHHLRSEKRAGASPDEQLADSLGRISREIDVVTRQLAEGSLDDLAIKTRFLEYKYGEDGYVDGERTSSREQD